MNEDAAMEPHEILVDWNPPDNLSPIERRYWDGLYPVLRESGRLKDEDIHPFIRMCELYCLSQIALSAIKSNGLTVEVEGDRGQIRTIKSPESELYIKICAELFKIEQKFGITPKSRDMIKANGDKGNQPNLITKIT